MVVVHGRCQGFQGVKIPSRSVLTERGGFARTYDRLVDGVVEEMRTEYEAHVVKGLTLRGVRTVDRIGHVAFEGLPLVLNHWALWVRMAMDVNGGRRARM